MLYRNRFYAPSLGRFVTRDPIGYRGRDWNLHRYCGNRSINAVDPSGLITPGGGGIANPPQIPISGGPVCIMQAYEDWNQMNMVVHDDGSVTFPPYLDLNLEDYVFEPLGPPDNYLPVINSSPQQQDGWWNNWDNPNYNPPSMPPLTTVPYILYDGDVTQQWVDWGTWSPIESILTPPGPPDYSTPPGGGPQPMEVIGIPIIIKTTITFRMCSYPFLF